MFPSDLCPAVRPPHARHGRRNERHRHHHFHSLQQSQETQGARRHFPAGSCLGRTQRQPLQSFRQWAQAWSVPSRTHQLVPHHSCHTAQNPPLYKLLSHWEPPPHRQLLQSYVPPFFRLCQPTLLDILSVLLVLALERRCVSESVRQRLYVDKKCILLYVCTESINKVCSEMGLYRFYIWFHKQSSKLEWDHCFYLSIYLFSYLINKCRIAASLFWIVKQVHLSKLEYYW